jgi:hypothetical protein
VLVLALPPGYDRPLVNADELADELAGLCHVYVLGGHLAWRRLLDEVGEESRVPQGGVRLYWPGWPGTDDRHPWWTRSWLQHNRGRLPRQLFGTLARLSVIRTPRDGVLNDLRKQATDELRRRATEGAGEELTQFLEEYEKEVTAELAAAKQAEGLARGELAKAELRILELEDELSAQREQWAQVAKASAAATAIDDEPAKPAPASWDEIAASVDDLESGALNLTETATDMLSGNSYPDPARMWWALTQLRDAADAWRARGGRVGGRLKEWIQEEFEIEISLQDKKLRGKMDFEYDGEKYSAEPHVKLDDFKTPDRVGRIYFAIDQENLRFIVDHVGLHR